MKNTWFILIAVLAISYSANITAGSPFSDDKNKFDIGLKAGLNLSNIYDSDNQQFDADPKLGLAGGLFVTIPINGFIGVQPEFLFSQRGYRGSGTILFNDYSYVQTSNFIDVPLLLAIKPIPMFTFLVGPQYSYLMSQQYVFSSQLINLDLEEEYENGDIRKNTLCLTGGIDYKMNQLVISARAGWDLINNKADGTSTTPRYKNIWSQITVGVRF
jgi:hypothetical protein